MNNDRINKGRTLVTVDDWLMNAVKELEKANIPSAQLDAELLLCYMLGVDRTWLIAHKDESLHRTALHNTGSKRRGSLIEHGDDLLLKRLQRMPIAYITGHKEFYGRDFIVTTDTLIPRPETESLVEMTKKLKLSGKVLDVGTGSGCVGLTMALELPDVSLTVSDISEEVLKVAGKNAKQLGVKPFRAVQSDLLEHWVSHEKPQSFDAIVANLPYVDRTWDTSPETKFEPDQALYAADNGLEIIKKCIQQAAKLIVTDGYLLLEADPEQHMAIDEWSKKYGFKKVTTNGYAQAFQKT